MTHPSANPSDTGWAGRFGRFFDPVRAHRDVLWAVRVPLVVSLVLATLFVAVPQCRDVFRAFLQDVTGPTTDRPITKFLGLLATSLAGSLALWFWSRQGLRLLVDGGPKSMQGFIAHLPRAIGVLPIVAIAAGLLRASSADVPSLWRYAIAGLFIVLAAALYCLLWVRRRIRILQYSDTPGGYLVMGFGGAALALLVFVLSLYARQHAFLFGPAGVVWLGGAFWATLLSPLTIHGARHRIPWLLLIATAALAFGVFNWSDNHEIRHRKDESSAFSPPQPIAQTSIVDGFREWKKNRPDGPIVFVAAEGGGIYAAYHAAYLLSRLHHETEGRFDDRVFLISSVSGGSIGAGIYVSLVAANGGSKSGAQASASIDFVEATRKMLDDDLLSPLLAVAAGPDALQRLLPIPIRAFDRARALEDTLALRWVGLQKNWRAQSKRNVDWSTQGSFWDVWLERTSGAETLRTDIPALLVHTTNVETGSRATLGPYSLPSGGPGASPTVYHLWASAKDLAIPLPTALVLSARFPFVTPPGKLSDIRLGPLETSPNSSGNTSSHEDHEPEGKSWRFADGGYFENSGRDTVYDVLRLLGAVSEKDATPLLDHDRVFVLSLETQGAAPAHNNEGLADTLTPIRTILRTRGDRAAVAGARLEAALGQRYIKSTLQLEKLATTLSKNGDESTPDIPLGWMLSADSKHQIRKQVDENLKRILTDLGDLKN